MHSARLPAWPARPALLRPAPRPAPWRRRLWSPAWPVGLALLLTACRGSGGSGTSASQGGSSSGGTSGTPAAPTDVVTFKNDVQRTGQNLTETVLTPANVNSSQFGLLHNLMVDGKVDAQPLYLSQLSFPDGVHDTVFVATENASVYAFDADSGAMLWQVSLLAAGESPSDDHGCNQITPSIGVTSTPVIDRHAGAHGVLFAVAMSKDASQNYHQRLHALDVTTGAEIAPAPVEITASFGATTFDPGQYAERAALLLTGGTLYTSWTSHCDAGAYGGWIIAYSESTLAQTGVLNVAAGASGSGLASQGPSIWMSGDGPAADSDGNVYVLTANGRFDTTLVGGFPGSGDYGNSFVKVSPGTLKVADYFTMYNEVSESQSDTDLGSGGILLLPDQTDSAGTVHHLAVGAGKDSNLYVVDRDSMGGFVPTGNSIYQELTGVLGGGVWGSPAYFNGMLYYGPVGGPLQAFRLTNAQLSGTAVAQTSTTFTYPGTSPVISASGTANAIVWAHENADPGVLHAYDAGSLMELYNSNQAGTRDQFGAGNKFIVPAVADGRVFVGTTDSVAVFGLLN